MTLTKHSVTIVSPHGSVVVDYYLGKCVVQVILQDSWDWAQCDFIRGWMHNRHPRLPVIFGPELKAK